MDIDTKLIQQAKNILCAGGVVILPTDTVYGIGAHPAFPSAIRRIQQIKGRPTNKPIALLVADAESVKAFGAVFPAAAEKLAAAYWPGALTLVLPCGDKAEGFRVPDHDFTRALLKACGGALRVTSANLSGQMPALSAAETLRSIGLESDLVIDGGVSPGGVASTVVKVEADGKLTILREGAISRAEILGTVK
jgi:L-threonylcarbamoyladenylate synthase